METDDPALGLSANESTLPPSRSVRALQPSSFTLLSVFRTDLHSSASLHIRSTVNMIFRDRPISSAVI